VRVDEARHQELLAVADGAGARVLAAQRAPVADGGDARARHQDRGVGEDAGAALAGIRDDVVPRPAAPCTGDYRKAVSGVSPA